MTMFIHMYKGLFTLHHLRYLGRVHIGSQVPLLSTSLDMEAKSQVSSFKKQLEYHGLHLLKSGLAYLMQKILGLVLRVGSSFLLNPTL